MCVVVSWQMCAWTLLCVTVTQQEWTYCGLAPPWSLTLVRGLRFLNADFFFLLSSVNLIQTSVTKKTKNRSYLKMCWEARFRNSVMLLKVLHFWWY